MVNRTVEESDKYQNWRHRLETNGLRIRSVEEKYTHEGDEGQLLYSLLKVEAEAADGSSPAQICFLRGDSVSMLVVLVAEETDEKFVLLVRQRRLCDGSMTYEHPAGMIEEGEEPAAVAARELEEECGLDVQPDELRPLFDRPLYSMSSNSDERLFFFCLERRLPEADIRAMHGKSEGKEEEDEQTRLEVHSFPEAHRLVNNLHGVLGHLLYLQQTEDSTLLKRL